MSLARRCLLAAALCTACARPGAPLRGTPVIAAPPLAETSSCAREGGEAQWAEGLGRFAEGRAAAERGQTQQALRAFESAVRALDPRLILEVPPKRYQPAAKSAVEVLAFEPQGLEPGAAPVRSATAAARVVTAALAEAARIYVLQRQWVPAQILYQRAEGCAHGLSARWVETIHLHQSWLAARRGDWEEVQESVVLRGCGPESEGGSVLMLCTLLRAVQGRRAEARALLERAARSYSAGGDPRGRAGSALLAAVLQLQDGALAPARAALEALVLEPAVREHPALSALATLSLARARWRQGEPAPALEAYLLHLEGVERASARFGTDEGKLSTMAAYEEVLDEAVEVAAQLADVEDAEPVRAIAERVRRRGFQALSRGLERQRTPGELPEAYLQREPSAMAMQMARAVSSEGVDDLGPKSLAAPVATLEYFVLPERTLAFVARPGLKTRMRSLPLSRQALRAEVEALRRSVDAAGARGGLAAAGGVGGLREVSQASQRLHAALLAPLLSLLPPPGERLLLVPHDALWSLPFALLRAEDGGSFGERHPLLLGLSASYYAQLAARPRGPMPPRSALLVGAPEAPAATGCGGAARQWAPLPGARDELRSIAALLGAKATVLSGASAVRLPIEAWHPRYDLIHFATHGETCPLDPLGSLLVLAPFVPAAWSVGEGSLRRRGAGAELPVHLSAEAAAALSPPGALSALAEGDGHLTARQVLERFELSADLVVLSACESGLGLLSAEGFVGLPRAFQAVGARSLLVSLWRVPDQPTELLMRAFYREYLRHGDKARALSAAMGETRARYPAPAAWAGFVLLGAAE